MKLCRTCGDQLSEVNSRIVDRKYIYYCRPCDAKRAREWKIKNPEKYLQRKLYMKENYYSNSEYKDKKRKEISLWRSKNPEQALWKSAKARAKKFGVPFTITSKDVVIPTFCPALGIPLIKGTAVCGPNSPTLDRIIPDLGYVPNNIIVISLKANTIKNDVSSIEIRRVADWLEKIELNR